MNEAIRRTASPFVSELATNAVRHGAAKTIRIAGALENGRLLFSVSDDGGGFNPQRHPGVDEGHFGLDGIRERISRFDGTLEIESAPNKGSTIRISMTA